MSRPTIDKGALSAMLQAAKDSEPDSRTVFKQERKREAEESLDEGPTKRLKAENPTNSHVAAPAVSNPLTGNFEEVQATDTETAHGVLRERLGSDTVDNGDESLREPRPKPGLDITPDRAHQTGNEQSSGWSGGDVTLAIHEDDQGDKNANESSSPKDDLDTAEQGVMSEEERRIESDMLLVNAYHAMSAAAQDIAFWATQTAEALEKKVVASRREVGAAAATLRAQEGYEEAMARIGQAMAHRAGGGLATSANGASD